jgi:hypothetical protein
VFAPRGFGREIAHIHGVQVQAGPHPAAPPARSDQPVSTKGSIR